MMQSALDDGPFLLQQIGSDKPAGFVAKPIPNLCLSLSPRAGRSPSGMAGIAAAV